MAEVKKILGQAKPAATTGDYMYTVPDSKGAVLSCISVCNTGAGSATYRIHIVNAEDGSATVNNALIYDKALASKGTDTYKLGITLSNLDQVYVYSDSADVSYHVYGAEFDQTNVYTP